MTIVGCKGMCIDLMGALVDLAIESLQGAVEFWLTRPLKTDAAKRNAITGSNMARTGQGGKPEVPRLSKV
jgi:hypothetical protein